jgi:hypothetical protein
MRAHSTAPIFPASRAVSYLTARETNISAMSTLARIIRATESIFSNIPLLQFSLTRTMEVEWNTHWPKTKFGFGYKLGVCESGANFNDLLWSGAFYQ